MTNTPGGGQIAVARGVPKSPYRMAALAPARPHTRGHGPGVRAERSGAGTPSRAPLSHRRRPDNRQGNAAGLGAGGAVDLGLWI